MRAEDQFHVGIVVDDVEATLETLSELFGYEWCDVMAISTAVSLPTGDAVVDLAFTYSKTVPRLEIIRTVPGTFWAPADSGIHHLGYWSDDVVADSAELVWRGFEREASGLRPDGVPQFAFHRGATGPRIELVSRSVQAGLEHYWSTGSFPS